MRGLFSGAHPSFDRLLVIESGPREVTERLLRHLNEIQRSRSIDLLTCYPNRPQVFDPQHGRIFHIHHPAIAHAPGAFLRALLASQYSVVAILCTGHPVLTKWKWWIALRTGAKVLIVNEHADYFFLDFAHRRTAQLMLAQRLGLPGKIRLRLLAEFFLVPFSLAWLLLYAAAVHLRRAVRTRGGLPVELSR